MRFDYHREMAQAAAERAPGDLKHLEWVMTRERLIDLRRHLAEDLGVDSDGATMFGIPVTVGEPSDGGPFELRLRA